MSFISRSASRLISLQKSFVNSVGVSLVTPSHCSVRPLARSLVVLSTPSRTSSYKQNKPSNLCSCGCGIHGMHTKGDRELVEFLQEEIAEEKKNLGSSIPARFQDFSIKKEQAELLFTKNFNDEIITVSVNVNHTLRSVGSFEENQQANQEDALESRPDFEVDVKVGSKIFSFTCQFTPDEPVEAEAADNVEDAFSISELTIYEGEWGDKTYCVSGDIMDGTMYNLCMNYLAERGVTEEFGKKLRDLCTEYEHSLYVDFLQNLQNFIKRK